MREAVKNTQDHIKKHRAKYAAATTFTVCLAAHIATAARWNEFLEKRDLTNEYYTD